VNASNSSVDRIQDVAALVRQHGGPELADWFIEGVTEFLGRPSASLDGALGLRGPGPPLAWPRRRCSGGSRRHRGSAPPTVGS
jgi:hypothetical protein